MAIDNPERPGFLIVSTIYLYMYLYRNLMHTHLVATLVTITLFHCDMLNIKLFRIKINVSDSNSNFSVTKLQLHVLEMDFFFIKKYQEVKLFNYIVYFNFTTDKEGTIDYGTITKGLHAL